MNLYGVFDEDYPAKKDIPNSFLDLWEELESINQESLLAEGNNKKSRRTDNLNSFSDETAAKNNSLDQLKSFGLITVSEAFGLESSKSPTGWTILIKASRVSDIKKNLISLDRFLTSKLKPFIEVLTIDGRGSKRFETKKIINNEYPIFEYDFGSADNNQYRGIGFTFSIEKSKYIILTDIFMKKRRAIDSGDPEVIQANKLYSQLQKFYKKA